MSPNLVGINELTNFNKIVDSFLNSTRAMRNLDSCISYYKQQNIIKNQLYRSRIIPIIEVCRSYTLRIRLRKWRLTNLVTCVNVVENRTSFNHLEVILLYKVRIRTTVFVHSFSNNIFFLL